MSQIDSDRVLNISARQLAGLPAVGHFRLTNTARRFSTILLCNRSRSNTRICQASRRTMRYEGGQGDYRSMASWQHSMQVFKKTNGML